MCNQAGRNIDAGHLRAHAGEDAGVVAFAAAGIQHRFPLEIADEFSEKRGLLRCSRKSVQPLRTCSVQTSALSSQCRATSPSVIVSGLLFDGACSFSLCKKSINSILKY